MQLLPVVHLSFQHQRDAPQRTHIGVFRIDGQTVLDMLEGLPPLPLLQVVKGSLLPQDQDVSESPYPIGRHSCRFGVNKICWVCPPRHLEVARGPILRVAIENS